MSTALDVRQPQQTAALAIRPGQGMWDEFQMAALDQIGLKDAGNADRAVFLHQCQRTGLDPFARQIHMIARNEKQRDGSYRTKWTIQTGIDGWRVIRDRAARRDSIRVATSRAIWYDDEGAEYKVWVRETPAAACEITVTAGDVAYTSVLLYREYVQTRDGKPLAQWRDKPNHMLEKCTEADALRKAFPQDFAGVSLDDAMPPADDAPAVTGARVTAADIRGGTRPQVRAEIVRDPEDASPAATAPRAPDAQPAPPAEQVAGEARTAMATGGQVGMIQREFERLGYDLTSPDDERAVLRRAARIAVTGDIAALNQLSQDQANDVRDTLKHLSDVAELDELLAAGERPNAS